MRSLVGDAGAEKDEDGSEEDKQHGAKDTEGVKEIETPGMGEVGFDAQAVLDGGGDLKVGGVDGVELRLENARRTS